MKKHLTVEDIRYACRIDENQEVCIVSHELMQGLDFMKKYSKAVTFYGSARFKEGDLYYEAARTLACKIVSTIGYAVVSGGGPGIMEGANRGASECGGDSLGLSIELPKEQDTNPYVTDSFVFSFFFTRKQVLSYASEAFVFFPGGYGTFDELFEILTLIQTEKIPPIPVILYGYEFWEPLIKIIRHELFEIEKTIDLKDVEIFTATEDMDEIVKIIKDAPVRIR